MNSGYPSSHSGNYYGKRKHEEIDDYYSIRLPPPLNYSESSSSSSVSSTSPKLNTIQNLLNEGDNKQHYHPSRPSAFYRLTAGSDTRYY
ncbi:hypothetical protein BCV71DRAFT_226109 [Rhizopus microsporus]|nr:hypothetical protein BCV71DRAFT_226109 [Rhizopus microsporus]